MTGLTALYRRAKVMDPTHGSASHAQRLLRNNSYATRCYGLSTSLASLLVHLPGTVHYAQCHTPTSQGETAEKIAQEHQHPEFVEIMAAVVDAQAASGPTSTQGTLAYRVGSRDAFSTGAAEVTSAGVCVVFCVCGYLYFVIISLCRIAAA
jgi:hypothetical protein